MAQFSSELDELLRVCTVRLRVGQGSDQGTGFFVAPGLILTCAHVVEAAQPNTKPVQVDWNGQSHTAKIQTCLAKPYPDLTLLCLDLQHHPCVYLYQEATLRDPLYSYGYTDDYPNGDSATFEYEGPTDEQQTLLKLKEGQARPGLSGAPLLNLRTGAVCGIVKSTRDRSSDLGARAIPISTVLSRLSDLANLQQRFHQQDKRWLGCLTSEQWQWVPWKTAVVHNPFYGESPHLLGRDEEIRRIKEKLQVGNHCSIVGPHGSGKSLLLKEIIQKIPSWLGCQPYEVLKIPFRSINNLRDLQEAIVVYLGGQKAGEWRGLLHHKPLCLLVLDDLGGMDPGQNGLKMRRWLRGLDDGYRTKLLMVSNERLDRLFRKDDPNRDSPFAGLDLLPVELAPLPTDVCRQIVEQRLSRTNFNIHSFADLLNMPRQPKDLLDSCAARYEALRQGNS